MLDGAIMPDDVQIGWETTEYQEHIEGATFDEWKEKFLTKLGGSP
jgi:hypothetical protein